MIYLLLATAVATGGEAQKPSASANAGLVIVAAEFGMIGARRKLDIVQPLQRLCGTASDSCGVFCSETSFGRYRLGRKPICRVTYRCPDRSTRSVEAAREEPILLRCGNADDEQDRAVASGERLSPPPYISPSPSKN